MPLRDITRALNDAVAALSFGPPVTHVYNPLEYASEAHGRYLDRYGHGPKEAILLGMNPGPYGMAQTGIPFGEIAAARDWLGVEAPVGKPPIEHPKRPVTGFDCPRSEVSGRRLWTWAKERFGTPERFFERFFVVNYCPLAFMEESGRNRTPDKLPAHERKALFEACDTALNAIVTHLQAPLIIGVGAFAEQRARRSLAGRDLRFGRILHPSPASPLANRGWAQAAEADFAALGVNLP